MALLNNIFQKNRIAAEQLIRDTIEYTVAQFKQDRQSFTVASAYGQIIFVLENLTQLILFYVEDSITELNIRTATRANSVYGLAALAGHNSTRAIAATGNVSLTLKNVGQQSIPGGIVVIPNYTKMACTNNGITYVLDLPSDEVRMPLDGSKNNMTFNIIQGTIETQVFTGNGGPLQSFTANFNQSVLIDHFFVNVYVNGEKYKKYDALTDIPKDGKGCLVKTGIISGVDVFFGNSFFGKMPPLGSEVRVEYLVTIGDTGNLQVQEGETVIYNWSETGFDLFGNEVDLNETLQINSVNPPDFGTNPEPLALTRIIAPKTSRSYTLANTDSYIIFLDKFNIFSIVDAFTSPPESLDDQNVIYLFLVPDVMKTLKSNENYFNIDEARFILSDYQKLKVLTLIEESGSKIVTTEVSIVDPILSRYILNIALIVFDDVAQDQIKQDIMARLSNYFISIRRRDRIPRSDLIAIIESVNGVDSVNMSIVSEKDEAALILNPLALPIGLDEFGDIIIQTEELPIIRGGWSDRRGLAYDPGINPDKPSSVNILVKNTVTRTYNTSINDTNKSNLKTSTNLT